MYFFPPPLLCLTDKPALVGGEDLEIKECNQQTGRKCIRLNITMEKHYKSLQVSITFSFFKEWWKQGGKTNKNICEI